MKLMTTNAKGEPGRQGEHAILVVCFLYLSTEVVLTLAQPLPGITVDSKPLSSSLAFLYHSKAYFCFHS